MLPRDISQQIFNELVFSGRLNEVSLEAFRDCALQVLDGSSTWLFKFNVKCFYMSFDPQDSCNVFERIFTWENTLE